MAEYNKTYSRINWENEPSKKTALSATNLNRIDLGLNVVDDRVIELNTIKAEKSIVNNLVKDVSFTPETGVFQIVKQDGSTITYDTKLEKLAVNFTYDPLTQKLIIILDDGTKQEVDLSTLVADYEFVDTNTVGFTKQPDGKILANIKNGSITEEKLQPNYLSEIKQQVNSSTQNVIQSENFANQSKRWAIGIDEEPSSLIDNSKYYSEEAKRYAEQAENTVGFGIATTEKAGIVKPDGVTITVAEDGTISGANKVDIATSTTVGVVKPSQDLTIAPDGTLGINTLFLMIEERANIQSGDTWETVLAKINKNLGDLKPLAFLDKVTESYLDTLITNKINNAIQKSQIVNNTVTTVEGTVLDGRVGKNLQDQISNTNNFIFNKGENAQISNVDNAPFGISTAYSSAINSPYTFWSTILTTGQEMFSQQLALPWSYADKSLKYRVKDSGIWSEWNECLTKKSSSSKDLNYETFGLVYCDEATLNTPFKQKITGSTQGICLTGLYNLNKWNTQLFLGNGDDLFYRFATDKGYSNWRNVSGISNQNGVDIRTLDTGSYYITNGINTPQDYPHGYLTVQRLDSNWAFLTFQHPYGSEYKMFVTKQTEGIWQNWANIQVTV